MKDFFYYSMIRSKDENTTKTRKLDGTVPLDELPNLMRAMGYYPTEHEVKQMKDEDFDIFMIVPPPILRAIDFFLKTGLTITTILFILSGFGITAEAWSVATSNPLPENVDSFIVNVIEPNFTPGLLVLLGFSVCLGIFATAQLGSGSSTYKEQ